MYALLAEALLAIHFLFVAFIVIGLIVIWSGYFLKWSFVRNFYFRISHLIAMGFVLAETILGFVCPLTEWEANLRQLAGHESFYSESFMSYWIASVMYYELPHSFFVVTYMAVFLLIAIGWWIVPPARFSSKNN